MPNKVEAEPAVYEPSESEPDEAGIERVGNMGQANHPAETAGIYEESQSPNSDPNFQKINQAVQQQSSQSDNDEEQNLEAQLKRREQLWKDQNDRHTALSLEQEEQLAFAEIERTNRRVLIARKTNQKRFQQLLSSRSNQQSYLIASNTHFRGAGSDYPTITRDKLGYAFYHPNQSMRVPQIRIDQFIHKNIKEQLTANYHNEVVKYQNYAYQQRKKKKTSHD